MLRFCLLFVLPVALTVPLTNNDPPPAPPFTCTKLPKSPAPPTDARHIRFTDVAAIAAVGDSITAAFAAEEKYKLDGLREFKGISWSIGGDDKYFNGEPAFTVPNFLGRVSGNVPKGASHGDELPVDAIRNKQGIMPYWGNSQKDQLNAAQSEAKVQDVPRQIEHVAQQLKLAGVDVNNDWKVLTILIGANNGCGACHGSSSDTAAYYKAQYEQVLGNITTLLPKTFVNMVQMFNISGVYAQLKTSKYCMDIQEKFKECGCLMGSDADRTAMDVALQSYNDQIVDLAAEWNAKNLTDHYFAVQPALRNMPVFSRDYLSGVECFHPSYLAHGALAIGLWNNMLNPPATKATTLIPGKVQIQCPTADQYLQ